MSVEVGAGRARNSKKTAGRTTRQGRGVREVMNKAVAMADAKMSRPSGNVLCAANGTNHIPVTIWGPDGSCFEGMSPHVTGEIIFVESNQLVPVETEVSIRLTPSNEALANCGIAKGVVVWQCLSSDHFKNRKGFGVCLQSRWPQPLGPTESDGSREAA